MKRFLFFCFLMIFTLVHTWAYEEGYASWYGQRFHGKKTANGEIFDMLKLTAAHKSLPFNTYVRVTNLANGKSVVVRINDRGPFIQGRIIDLSKQAALAIGLLGQGVVKVRVEVLKDQSTPLTQGKPPVKAAKPQAAVPPARVKKITTPTCTIQVGSFSQPANALRAQALLKKNGYNPVLEKADNGYTRVLVPQVPTEQLDRTERKLNSLGFTELLIREEYEIRL